MDIKQSLELFRKGIGNNNGLSPNQRSASFDYCFNHFQSFREEENIDKLAEKDHMELSCLHLGFYLASWGMLRGSSFLLRKSLRFYQSLIEGITNFDRRIWNIDVDSYDSENIDLLLLCRNMIVDALGRDNHPSDTLTTKIMLGIFGNVPAFDRYFRRGLGVHSFGAKSLGVISSFYERNKTDIDKIEIFTFDYATGEHTDRKYPKAKIIDMIKNMEGFNKTSSSPKAVWE